MKIKMKIKKQIKNRNKGKNKNKNSNRTKEKKREEKGGKTHTKKNKYMKTEMTDVRSPGVVEACVLP